MNTPTKTPNKTKQIPLDSSIVKVQLSGMPMAEWIPLPGTVTAAKEPAKMIEKVAKQLIEIEIKDEPSMQEAVKLIEEGSRWLAAVETSRSTAKAPFLAVCQQIDALARELTQELLPAVNGLRNRLGLYVNAEREKEIRERAEAQQKQREAFELARRTTAELASIEPESAGEAKAVAKAQAAVHQELVSVTQSAQRQIEKPSTTASIKVKMCYGLEVFDAQEAYKHVPEIFDLVVNRTKFNGAMEAFPERMKAVPGLQIVEMPKARVK